MEMSRLTRDGTTEPVSRDQILRHAQGQGNIHFPCSADTSRIGNLTRLIHTLLYVMTIHTYYDLYTKTSVQPTLYRLTSSTGVLCRCFTNHPERYYNEAARNEYTCKCGSVRRLKPT